jgi:hypothetical protein
MSVIWYNPNASFQVDYLNNRAYIADPTTRLPITGAISLVHDSSGNLSADATTLANEKGATWIFDGDGDAATYTLMRTDGQTNLFSFIGTANKVTLGTETPALDATIPGMSSGAGPFRAVLSSGDGGASGQAKITATASGVPAVVTSNFKLNRPATGWRVWGSSFTGRKMLTMLRCANVVDGTNLAVLSDALMKNVVMNVYNDDTTALLNAATTQPSPARKLGIDQRITELRGWNNIWSNHGYDYNLIAHDAQFAQLDWKNPGSNYALVPTMGASSSVTFNSTGGNNANGYPNGGYTGVNIASGPYLKMGAGGRNAGQIGGGYIQDDAWAALKFTDAPDTTHLCMGVDSGSAIVSIQAQNDTHITGRLNRTATATAASGDNRGPLGDKLYFRHASTGFDVYDKGVYVATLASVSEPLSVATGGIYLLRQSSQSVGNTIIRASAGGGMTAQKIVDRHAINERFDKTVANSDVRLSNEYYTTLQGTYCKEILVWADQAWSASNGQSWAAGMAHSCQLNGSEEIVRLEIRDTTNDHNSSDASTVRRSELLLQNQSVVNGTTCWGAHAFKLSLSDAAGMISNNRSAALGQIHIGATNGSPALAIRLLVESGALKLKVSTRGQIGVDGSGNPIMQTPDLIYRGPAVTFVDSTHYDWVYRYTLSDNGTSTLTIWLSTSGGAYGVHYDSAVTNSGGIPIGNQYQNQYWKNGYYAHDGITGTATVKYSARAFVPLNNTSSLSARVSGTAPAWPSE